MVIARSLAVAVASSALALALPAAADPKAPDASAGGVSPSEPPPQPPVRPEVRLPPPVAPASPPPPANPPPAPRVHHAPISSAAQWQALDVRADIEHPELVRSAVVVYKNAKGKIAAVPLERAEDGYVGVIPAADVASPTLGYSIELERTDGVRVAAFATREDPFPVEIMEDRLDARERALAQRLEQRRSVVTTTGEYVRFGTTEPTSPVRCGANQSICKEGEILQPSRAKVDDQYWRVEAGYTYRPLKSVAEFSLRGGVVRGTSLVAGDYDEEKNKVGLNYGATTVRFRLADAWHLEGELLTSITEIGFSVGTGAALLIGDPYGTKLTLGWETIGVDPATYFGTRFMTRLDIAIRQRVTVAPIIEVTDMPHAESFGVRLLGDLTVALGGGFSFGLRGGYQARRSTSGGPTLGALVALGF